MKTKSSVPPTGSWDQANSEYEEAIQRCYKWKSIPLALCGFQKFSAFNFTYKDNAPRKPYIEGDFKFHGVVHENWKFERHVRCEVGVVDAALTDDTMGHLVLTHTGLGDREDKIRPEEKDLELEIFLRDPDFLLKTSLVEGLRDAALSGLRFTHIELVCSEPTSEQLEQAMTDMRKNGCGPSRDILAVKMWSKIELENAPQWARHID